MPRPTPTNTAADASDASPVLSQQEINIPTQCIATAISYLFAIWIGCDGGETPYVVGAVTDNTELTAADTRWAGVMPTDDTDSPSRIRTALNMLLSFNPKLHTLAPTGDCEHCA